MENIKSDFIKEYNKLIKLYRQNKLNISDFENILSYKFLDNFTINLIKSNLKYNKFENCLFILSNIGQKNYF